MEVATFEATPGSTGSAVWARRAASTCGALFTFGILVGDDTINRAGEAPSPFDRRSDSLGRVEDYLVAAADASADGTYWVGRGIGTLALVALLVFSAYVAGLIRLHGHRHEMSSGVALGAGNAAVALGLVSCAAQFAAVARANDIDLQVAGALLDFSSVTFVMMWLPIAVLMLAVAVAGRRHSLVPRWFTVTTAVVAGALLVGLAMMPLGNVGFVAVMMGFLWFIAASVVLFRRAGDGQPEPRVS